MEANKCDINRLDSDVILPPRKRLLAGFKKQNYDGDTASHPPSAASSSLLPSSPTSPSSLSTSEFQTRLKNLLNSHLDNHNLSPEEIVEASKSAAISAVKAAEVARSLVEEKAAIAAKAVAAAKKALDMVATFSEEAAGKERWQTRGKLKKHVPVQLLYKRHQPVEKCRTDEEVARRLHRAINTSPRISKNSSSSNKHKRHKGLPSSDNNRVSNGSTVLLGESPSLCNGHAVAGDLDLEISVHEVPSHKGDEKVTKNEKDGQSEMDNGEAESSHSKDKFSDDSPSKKRGRVKLKKLPLNICNFRDHVNPKEELILGSSALTEKNVGKPPAGSIPLYSVDPSGDGVMSVKVTQTWKCQEFKAPNCFKQSKIIQS
ncbi:hypothetical protein HS088_TW14G00010 [Tripterygium wilfordii]|uniref:Uncharacterized protein n=1 Tax=Tripterygium wilfordii TaxID=458696 RepID=A0A7J7CP90_TRIWF|nr:uncharacterized protein LOC120014372 [Tripterygium wilfordii]XP_038722239.1 uncharacterized protein LOC120014372 [Tripterygium wilfordii]XP_038722240.1 uncharacterized protein LOC120014372 [Tripterygium wilfordii]KAF5735881.1 hypothetical protein HS088_TW14G00010 [Tripterygium wilfordii]